MTLGCEHGAHVELFGAIGAITRGMVEPMIACVRRIKRDGYRTAIITSNIAEFSEHWRRTLPLDELFDVVIDSSEVGMRKPNPQIFLRQVGLDGPTQTLDPWGLTGARITLPTRAFWLALCLVPSVFPAGTLAADAAAYAASTRAEQIETALQLESDGAGVDVDALDAALDGFYAFEAYDQETTFEILDDIDNTATPRQMVLFYWHLFFDNGLSADQDKQLRKIMKRGERAIDKRQINVGLRYWGGKGGSDLGMGNVAGYGETRNGNHILYAIMASHSTNEDADLDRIDQLITWTFDTLDAP